MGFELFSDRFEPVARLAEDPGFTLWLAEDIEKKRRVWVQSCGGACLREDVPFARQQEALLAFEEARGEELSEWIVAGDRALRVSRALEGPVWVSGGETLRDEIYLKWLGQALDALRPWHEAGFWHLAQTPDAWRLETMEGGEAILRLGLVPLLPELPFGMRVQPENVAAVAPECWLGAPLDARSDLYALAALVLRQRNPKAFERVRSVGAWLDLHLGGRFASFVPKTPSPLNDLLRRMLDPNPDLRPADARRLLAEISGAEGVETAAPPVPDWAAARARNRQATLYFRVAYDLLWERDARGRGLIETCPAVLAEAAPAMAAFLRAEALWQDGEPELARAQQEEFSRRLAERPDSRLEAAAALAEARRAGTRGEVPARARFAAQGFAALERFPDFELEAELRYEQGLAARETRRDAAALADLAWAWRQLGEVRGNPIGEAAGTALAELLAGYGREAEASRVMARLLERGAWRDAAALELVAALIELRRGDFAAAKEFFSRAKTRISAQKDLPRLVWAGLHELRLFTARGDFAQVARELKVLKVRARGFEAMREFVEMSELAAGLAAGSGATVSPEWEEKLEQVAAGAAPFREAAWPPAESCEWLGRAARYWGKAEAAERLEARARALRAEVAAVASGLEAEVQAADAGAGLAGAMGTVRESAAAKLREASAAPAAPETSPSPAPVASAPPGPPIPIAAAPAESDRRAEDLLRLQAENRALKERIRRLEAELSGLRTATAPQVAEASPPPPEVVELAAVRELTEKNSIVAILRKHLGNRDAAARELKIHRRTLFEKIRRFGLTDADFLPSRREVEATLAECRGNKSRAAARLGMSRSSFYRWWKNLRP